MRAIESPDDEVLGDYYDFAESEGVPTGAICSECGNGREWIDCWMCGGAGYIESYEDDPMWYRPGQTDDCEVCDGAGGWYYCHSCKAVTP